jgi:hypothetical protein
VVLETLAAVERWLAEPPVVSEAAVVTASLEAARQVRAQDVAGADESSPALRRGVARERRIALADPERRHRRKRRRQRRDGSKRHGRQALDPGLVRAGCPPRTLLQQRSRTR